MYDTTDDSQNPAQNQIACVRIAGTPPLKKNAELFFPPEFADDFPVAMQISEKYGLVYVITKLGLLFVYDLATATAVRLLACSQLHLRAP